MTQGAESSKRIVRIVTAIALLVAAGAAVAYFLTRSAVALRVLWIAGPIGLMALAFVLLQAFIPEDER